MAILTTAQLREHLDTDLGDDALGRLADAAESLIVAEVGQAASVTERFYAIGFPHGRDRYLYTMREIGSITSIKERDYPDDDDVILSANDYEVQQKRTIVRLREGDNPRLLWAQYVTIVYAPADESNLRQMVQVELVKCMIAFNGYNQYRAGDISVGQIPADTRRRVLAQLRTGANTFPAV